MSWLPGSIRGRLLLGLVVVIVGMNVALLSSSYRAARHEIDELFDAQLAQSARVLKKLLTPAAGAGDVKSAIRGRWDEALGTIYAEEDNPYGHEYESKIAFQVVGDDGRVRVRSESAPASRFLAMDHGFADSVIDAVRWRVFTLPMDGERGTVQVGQRLEIREELERRIAIKTVQKSLYGLPLLILLAWLVVGAGLRPLRRLTAEIRERSDTRLDPISLPGMTRDLRPIVTALDSLFARLRAAWRRERRFIDEAAHELRTPLAAIQLHAESLATATDPADREARLHELLAASARGSRLASQLLTLARVESNEAGIEMRPMALGPLLREEAALLAPLAERDGIDLSVDVPPSLPRVRGDAGLVSLLLRNLIDNAIRHSPQGGAVAIAARAADGGVVVTVDDEGPGIPAAERDRMMERFVRAGNGEGSGLGLAIVARIAEQHGTCVELSDNPAGRGLRTSLRLSVATTALASRRGG